MMNEKKNIAFNEIFPIGKRKLSTYDVYSKHGFIKLGVIKWYSGWRQFVFYPFLDTFYSWDCLKDIYEFIKELMDERIKSGGVVNGC